MLAIYVSIAWKIYFQKILRNMQLDTEAASFIHTLPCISFEELKSHEVYHFHSFHALVVSSRPLEVFATEILLALLFQSASTMSSFSCVPIDVETTWIIWVKNWSKNSSWHIYSKIISFASGKKLYLISHIAILFDSSAWITKHCS